MSLGVFLCLLKDNQILPIPRPSTGFLEDPISTSTFCGLPKAARYELLRAAIMIAANESTKSKIRLIQRQRDKERQRQKRETDREIF